MKTIKKFLIFLSIFATFVIPQVSFAQMASWYGGQFHGRLTASGERYNMNALTAAHNSLPFGSIVKVTNLTNKKSVKVRINDTGGFKKYGRAIDLSKRANDMIDCGLCKVDLTVLSRGDGKYKRD